MNHSLRRKLLFTGVTTLTALLVIGGILEVGLRVRYGRIERITGVNEWKTAKWQGIAYHWDEYHSRFGWTNRAGYRSPAGASRRVTINARGLRGSAEFADEPAGETERILVFGDSFTFGDEVNDDETIPAFMAEQMHEAEILNFGVHGYGAGQMLLRLEDEGLGLAPSHVVVIYPTQDYLRDPAPELTHTKPVFGVENGQLTITNIPVPEQSRMPWIYRHSFAAAWLYGPAVQPRWQFPVQETMEIFERIMLRLHEVCREKNVSLTIVHLPEPDTVNALNNDDTKTMIVHSRIVRILDQLDTDVLDLTDTMIELLGEHGEKLIAPGRHWSAPANRFIADQICEHLGAQQPGP